MNWEKYHLPAHLQPILAAAPQVTVINSITELLAMVCGHADQSAFEVSYEVPGQGKIIEANVARVRNGIVVNYPEPYMRRRDPDCLIVADDKPTDKPTFQERFQQDFDLLRQETFAWLSTQPLILFGFTAGQKNMGSDAVAIVPQNAAFFAYGLAALQGITLDQAIPNDFQPQAIVYIAPPFRHTHFAGKQVVVHNRLDSGYEMFAYNLYPGPSAKKGIYGILIYQGEREGWITAHCSTVQVITPYDNILTIMHEGASGGGKSEMLEQAHREPDGRLLLGENIITHEQLFLEMPRSCRLRPVTDDMALCHPSLQSQAGKLVVTDAEDAWFVRINHIDHYGADPSLEALSAQPSEPLVFLNIDAVPNSRALIWEHIQDTPGKSCPNPRVIIPRHIVPDIINEPVTVDIRSFGVRTPPCSIEQPSYGIIGLFHILPAALAWLWRLVAPRGYANPSVIGTEAMDSEGVGAYWPFATGRRVDQANLLLAQFEQHTRTRYILCPNQHIGAWKVGFMPQWIAREYLARRGSAQFRAEQLRLARCPLLGYSLRHFQVEGRAVAPWFLQVELQPEVGMVAYEQGAQILYDFFHKELAQFIHPELASSGREIIECCLDEGCVEDYERFIPSVQ
ncbi:hypothetical protein THII_0088 [Thioploca ingrica]|uniref:DUF4914 domain-containing protein n=1 Tax=Thioploca ingrica TaxID=40754 RepID=A0A090AHZ8_9GAMM|nr:hypothetical protein THII_0088 [Thioploca ingrica]